MSSRAIVTGQLSLQDQNSNVNTVIFDLANFFSQITNIDEYVDIKRELIDTDGVVSLFQNNIATIQGFAIKTDGEITVKHDSNTNGIKVNSGLIVFGELSTITIETTSTTTINVRYLIFG